MMAVKRFVEGEWVLVAGGGMPGPPGSTGPTGPAGPTGAPAELTDGVISSAKIADSAVTSAKIADGTIVDADISASAEIAQSKVSGLTTSLSTLTSTAALKAPIASPTFTGIPAAPSAAYGTSSTQLATTEYVVTAVGRANVLSLSASTLTLSSSYSGAVVPTTSNGTTVSITLPADSNIPVGAQVTFIQRGTSQIAFFASGTTIEATPGTKTRTQYSVATATKVASTVWSLYGDLTV